MTSWFRNNGVRSRRAKRLRRLRTLRAFRQGTHDLQDLCDDALLENPQNYELARYHRHAALARWVRMDEFKARLDERLPFVPKERVNA